LERDLEEKKTSATPVGTSSLPSRTTQTMPITSGSPPRKKPKIRASRLQSMNAEFGFS
jgi:hypothetical protein